MGFDKPPPLRRMPPPAHAFQGAAGKAIAPPRSWGRACIKPFPRQFIIIPEVAVTVLRKRRSNLSSYVSGPWRNEYTATPRDENKNARTSRRPCKRCQLRCGRIDTARRRGPRALRVQDPHLNPQPATNRCERSSTSIVSAPDGAHGHIVYPENGVHVYPIKQI